MIDASAIRAYHFPEQVQEYDARDAIIYALGLGLGRDPLGRDDLRFLDERDLAVLPTFAVTLGSPGMWIRDPALGVDFSRLVHSAQHAEFPGPLPKAARVSAGAKVISLTDRGAGRGAELVLERTIHAEGELVCRLCQTLLLRGDGGFGGPAAERPASVPIEGDPDAVIAVTTSPRAALIYRLSGDWNPLHLDPDSARAAGFDRPILHGLASYGMSGIAASRALQRDPSRISSLSCRFAGVVLPGDTLAFSVWRDGPSAAYFNARVADRSVLADGRVTWRPE